MNTDPHTPTASDRIKVKFIIKNPLGDDAIHWRRMLPDASPSFGRCDFTFDPDSRDYDWLAVYDELPSDGEELACPRDHTVLMTAEPSSIKVYGSAYLRQFGAVITSHEPWAMKHPNLVRHMSTLYWFYGRPHSGPGQVLGYDQLKARPLPEKDLLLSAAAGSKRMGHTLHAARYDFVQAVKAAIPETDLFGHGVKAMVDKAECLDRYRYHLALENHLGPHHITEKLTDAFLGGALPFYFGAPNASDYFPSGSFIPIDIRKPGQAIAAIKHAIASNEYEKRLEAIREARRRVLEERNMFMVFAREIERLDTGKRGSDGSRLLNRRVFRNRSLMTGLSTLIERCRVQAKARRAMRL